MLIEYLLGVWADWSIAKARGWSLHAAVEDVEALIKKDATARREANLARQQEMKLRTERFKTAEQEFKTRTAPINARLEEIKSQLSALPEISSSSRDENDLRFALWREQNDLENSEDAHWQRFSDQQQAAVHANLESLTRITDSVFGACYSMRTEQEDIQKALSIFRRATALRLVLEILFPAAYSTCALIWTFLHEFHWLA